MPLALLVLIPLSVHAGVFASLIGMGMDKDTAANTDMVAEAANAQTMPLLKAALHAVPVPPVGGGDIIIEEGALLPTGDITENESDDSLTANGEISVYVVREGDTLSEIAEMFDISAKTILWANEIRDPSLIKPGASLVILPITGVRHTVAKGDTIASIAKKYNGDVDDILAYNQLDSADGISIGEVIVVPGGEVKSVAPTYAVPTKTSGGTLASGGGFVNPAPGSTKTQGIHGYNGVDLASYSGAPIRAAAAGDVIVSKSGGWNGGYGSYIVVKHASGIQTLYAHLSANYVSVGAHVEAGETIGAMGSTGRSTGTHLHFEVRGAKNPF